MSKALKGSGASGLEPRLFFDQGIGRVGTGRTEVPKEGLLQVTWSALPTLPRIFL